MNFEECMKIPIASGQFWLTADGALGGVMILSSKVYESGDIEVTVQPFTFRKGLEDRSYSISKFKLCTRYYFYR